MPHTEWKTRSNLVKVEVKIPIPVMERWMLYAEENTAWVLSDLITQLMRQHFDEADAMKKSIQTQEEE